MIDFLFDITNDSVLYALYIIILQFTVKIAWVWLIEYRLTDTSTRVIDTNKQYYNDYQNISLRHINYDVFKWLITITKRRERPDDDSDPHDSFLTVEIIF